MTAILTTSTIPSSLDRIRIAMYYQKVNIGKGLIYQLISNTVSFKAPKLFGTFQEDQLQIL